MTVALKRTPLKKRARVAAISKDFEAYRFGESQANYGNNMLTNISFDLSVVDRHVASLEDSRARPKEEGKFSQEN
jgi:hypothetical protein